jgi:predicted PurR-regulated permease PerM
MISIELLFLMQCVLGILMLFFLLRINQLKKQVDTITKEVKAYLAFIEEEVESESVPENQKNIAKISKEEMENQVIQAVLQEYFP